VADVVISYVLELKIVTAYSAFKIAAVIFPPSPTALVKVTKSPGIHP
jgi:hypothetical protein